MNKEKGLALLTHFGITILVWVLCIMFVRVEGATFMYFIPLGGISFLLISIALYIAGGFYVYKNIDKKTYSATFSIFIVLLVILFIGIFAGYLDLVLYFSPVFINFIIYSIPHIFPEDTNIFVILILASTIPSLLLCIGIKIRELCNIRHKDKWIHNDSSRRLW